MAGVPETIHIPEVIEPDEKLPADLVAMRRFARLMDEAFSLPGTRFHVGLDPLLGLVPGIGDVAGAVLSTWIVVGALRHRVRPLVVARMILNILIDLVLGAVPVAGDLFDFLYEENMKNMRLLERYRDRRRPPRSTRQIALVVVAIVAFILAAAILIVIGLIAVVLWVLGRRPLV
jgi:Domain of unknown function (DUF4112)